MPKGEPATLQGWITKYSNMAQYSHLSVAEVEELAKHRMAEANGENPGEFKLKALIDLDDLAEQDPRFKKKFTKIWREVYKDIEGPKIVREHLAKQMAMSFLLAERLMLESWNGKSSKIGDGANQIERLSMVVSRYAQSLQQTPQTRKPGKGKDEQLLDVLSATGKAAELVTHAEELEQQDNALLGDGPETD